MSSRLPLLPLLQRYVDQDPAIAAQMIETMGEDEARSILRVLPPILGAQVFPHLHTPQAADLLEGMPPDHFAAIVQRLRPEQAVPVLLHLKTEMRKTLLDQLPPEIKRDLQQLLAFPENSAGRIMSTDFLALHRDVRVKDAVHKIRQLASKRAPTMYAYVVDSEGRLEGVLTMRDLLIGSSDIPLHSIMRKEVFAVGGFLDREEVAHELSRRHYFAAPVVDAEKRLLGVVKTEELIDDVQEEATEDILRMVGAGSDEQTFSPASYALRKRLPWLFVNLGTAFLAASVVALFEGIIAKLTILAVFLPVVAGQGGNAGAQSLAIVMRGLVMREIHPANSRRLILKETFLGLMNGLLVGVVTALVAWMWNGNPALGVVIGLAMIVNLTVAGLFGAAIPLGLKKAGLDPAQSSSIVLTTITDVIGFLSFLGFAVLFSRYLLPH